MRERKLKGYEYRADPVYLNDLEILSNDEEPDLVLIVKLGVIVM